MAYIFSGDNPSQLYLDALVALLRDGDEVSPQGKIVKEIRPVIFEFTNPGSKVTFVEGRTINPFFQVAEALWILAGRSDVKWLTQYNKNMASFSDNGIDFNAPYGERLRFWNQSHANNFQVAEPIEQLLDVVKKIQADPDTRQAVAVIYNPMFDNADVDTLDRPCNLILTFKLRGDQLDLTVFNRSNDLHWGVFGANLCQFATIQDAVASWLDVEVGTYRQITDSLHIYLDTFGAKETDKILNAYGLSQKDVYDADFVTPKVEQFGSKHLVQFGAPFGRELELEETLYVAFNTNLNDFFDNIDPLISNSKTYMIDENGDSENFDSVLRRIDQMDDEYMQMTAYMMLAYQAHKLKATCLVSKAMNEVPECDWKIAGLRFLYKRHGEHRMFRDVYYHMDKNVQNYIARKEG